MMGDKKKQLEGGIFKLTYNFCGWFFAVEHTCNDILSIVDIFIKFIWSVL